MQKFYKTSRKMTELILTNTERVRMHEDQRIRKEYLEMVTLYPEASPMRIMASIAKSGNFKPKSLAGVRSALIRSGAFIPEKRA